MYNSIATFLQVVYGCGMLVNKKVVDTATTTQEKPHMKKMLIMILILGVDFYLATGLYDIFFPRPS
jgi:hypothetical protein